MNEKQPKKANIKWLILSAMALVVVVLLFVFILRDPGTEPINQGSEAGNSSVEQTSTDDRTEKVGEKQDPPISDIAATAETGYALVTGVKTETVNAYDYILAVMNKPQYWSEDEFFPLYSAKWDEEDARKTLINGTGWKLVDEKKAIFERGYKGVLSINFSEHIAIAKDSLADVTYYFDYANNSFYEISYGERKEITQPVKTMGTEFYWQTVYGVIDATFRYYQTIFEAAGCPLLEMPAGTLAGYKNEKAHEVILADDGLIHAPWKQEGYSFDWEKNNDIEWIDNYKDIEKKKVPDCETVPLECYDINNQLHQHNYGKYSPLYLVLANKNGSSKYHKQDGSVWFDSELVTANISEALATYYLAPAMKNLYGYSGVFFTDVYKLSGPNKAYQLDTKEQFEQGFTYDDDLATQGILELFPVGTMYVGSCNHYQYNNVDYLYLVEQVRDAYKYHQKDYIFGEDYLANFMMMYDFSEQIILGLR